MWRYTPSEGRETPDAWRLRAKARGYGRALERGQHAWRANSRAQVENGVGMRAAILEALILANSNGPPL